MLILYVPKGLIWVVTARLRLSSNIMKLLQETAHQSAEESADGAVSRILLTSLTLIWRFMTRCSSTPATHAKPQRPDQKGGNPHWTDQRDLQTSQAGVATGMYMERQVRMFCQVHALNAMLGKRAVPLETMLSFCKAHAKDDTGLGRIIQHVSCQRDGNFGDLVINAFLHYHRTPAAWLYPVTQNIPMGSNADMFLRGLPTDQDAFMLRWNGGNMPHEGAYGHAVCVRRHPVSQEWYLLEL